MIIQNKKSGEQQSVTPVEWQRIKDIGFASNWNIISNEETPPRKVIPKEILSFQSILKKETVKTKSHGSKGKRTIPGDKNV